MRSPRFWAALCLLLTASCRLCTAARHGCLFEKKLCPRGQRCSDDGLFGQCQVPNQEPVQYQVSVPVLHKLQEVLKDLMVQGLTWKDDVTQAIIGRELSHVPTVGSGLQEKSPKQLSKLMGPERSRSWRSSRSSKDASNHSLRPGGPPPIPRSPSKLRPAVPPPPKVTPSKELKTENIINLFDAAAAPDISVTSPTEFDSPTNHHQQQQQQKKKTESAFGILSGLDERSLQRLALLADHYGLDMKDLSPEQKDDLPAALTQLQNSYASKQSKDKSVDNAAWKKVGTSQITGTESSKAYKTGFEKASLPAAKPDGGSKEMTPVETANQDRGGQKETEQAKEFGYIVTNQSVVGPSVTFQIRPNTKNLTAADVAGKAVAEKNFLESETGLKVLQSGAKQVSEVKSLPLATRVQPGSRWVFATLVAMACIGGILVAAMTIACLRHHAHRLAAKKLGLGPEGGGFSHQEYQDLCRQHMASKGAFGRMEAAALGAVGGASGGGGGSGGVGVGSAGAAGGGGADSRVSSVSSQFSDGAQPSPSSHSSTPSWCEEPAQANMDISTGHMILAYMEDHLRNKDRLMKEWEGLCSYQAEPSSVSTAQSDSNGKKNRCSHSVPYDHSRVKLKAEVNPSRSDYINASTIIEHDPRMPAYIATQGPLSHTISDFWQMVWENGCTVIVMMTALVEDGEKQCDRYWPDEGSSLYHIYEVNLVSEHIWCNDFLVRSFYLKNVQTQETRTLTQFHFLSWPAQGIPTSARPLLDFRRKVNKCYRGRSCPIIIHCSDGTSRTGTYVLIDMVLNRMAKGVKEIDIAASLEHIRDQRRGLVRTKDQFEFALTAVAEEVNAILKALPQ
uniref:Protein tyrosine phosphatase, receptor type, Nb n=1 Tax=Nothobranchius kuhntae TaxID=321403 RepID=A0A1A8J4Y3_NOTKU